MDGVANHGELPVTEAARNATKLLYFEILTLVHPEYNGVSIAPDGQGGISMLVSSASLHRCVTIDVDESGARVSASQIDKSSATDFDPNSEELASALAWLKK